MTCVSGKRKTEGWLALAAACLAVLLGSGDDASAMNMAFRHRKQIFALGQGAKGRNHTALPDRSPYFGPAGLGRLCDHLNLSNLGSIIQIDAELGIVNSFNCGQLQTFDLTPGVGVIVLDPTATDGLIVGSDIPGNSFTFHDLGATPIGRNLFPVEYHSTMATPEDTCQQCGLSATAQILRFDAQAGNVETHVCGQIALWSLVKGEAVIIFEPNGPVTCTPGHF